MHRLGVVQTIGVGSRPDGISSDGTHVWVSNSGDGTVSELAIKFVITTTSLPNAHSSPWGPVQLQVANVGTSASPYVTTVKWKKVSIPKGLKLSSSGVLSGTPSDKFVGEIAPVTVQATETVTTLNGKRKINTKATAQATIPLDYVTPF